MSEGHSAPVRASSAVSIAVTSGKGGVGKTSVTVNLAVALAMQRQRVAIVDADFGLGNVDVALGLTPRGDLGQVLAGHRRVHDVVVTGPRGIRVAPSGSGRRELTALTARQRRRLSKAMAALRPELDFLLIDTAAGISDNVVDLVGASNRVLLVTTPDPSALVDAYALIRVLVAADARRSFGVLVNEARSASEAGRAFRQVEAAVTRFVSRRLVSFGYIPHDGAMREACRAQRSIVDYRPEAPASCGFRTLASHVMGLKPRGGPGLRLVVGGVRSSLELPEVQVPQCA